jgi:hypothetical protein
MKKWFYSKKRRQSMKGLCHRCYASNVKLELDENKLPICIKCRDPLNVDHG